MSILVLNAGSSTVKLSLFDSEARELLASKTFETTEAKAALSDFLSAHAQTATIPQHIHPITQQSTNPTASPTDPSGVTLVGHRIVHGGTRFREPVLIDDEALKELRAVSELAPLHNPPALQALEEARKTFPQAAHVAVFDTAFFSNLPERAFIYPVPYRWFEDWGIRRFGFHGINHEYCARRATEMLALQVGRGVLAEPPPSGPRLIICHLGSGCSATAVHNGQPVATTMGFTPMEGLMMGTRAGSIDSGILIYLAKERGLTVAQLEHALNEESGLLGVSGCSSDYREIEKAAAQGNPRAKLACQLFEDRVVSAIGSLAALLGGVEALIFTAGTGEHRAQLRAAVCDRLRWMGVELDRDRNANATPDIDIAAKNSRIRVLVIRAREDLMIAQAARKLSV